jgi:hypothetical protein
LLITGRPPWSVRLSRSARILENRYEAVFNLEM